MFSLLVGCCFMVVSCNYIQYAPQADAHIKEGKNNNILKLLKKKYWQAESRIPSPKKVWAR